MSCTCPTCGGALRPGSEIRVDLEAGIVVGNGHAAVLTNAEHALFEALWSARPRTLSKEQLLAATSGLGFDDREIKIVDVFICKARKKLKPLGLEIGTVWGRGYRIVGGSTNE
ncbi:winged helix-turn-helix domain-containing protein [Devosia sp. Naph2]|uniref:winged helix-turn-helix domain-containing protein n=1 Tax=Devosia polycyclovorans TaxID=3345148 RepID=UPI0035CFCF1C